MHRRIRQGIDAPIAKAGAQLRMSLALDPATVGTTGITRSRSTKPSSNRRFRKAVGEGSGNDPRSFDDNRARHDPALWPREPRCFVSPFAIRARTGSARSRSHSGLATVGRPTSRCASFHIAGASNPVTTPQGKVGPPGRSSLPPGAGSPLLRRDRHDRQRNGKRHAQRPHRRKSPGLPVDAKLR